MSRTIREYPDGIMGPEMIENFHKQASRMGADLRIGYVSDVDFSQPPYKVTIGVVPVTFPQVCGTHYPTALIRHSIYFLLYFLLISLSLLTASLRVSKTSE
jgi:hypothetical protein